MGSPLGKWLRHTMTGRRARPTMADPAPLIGRSTRPRPLPLGQAFSADFRRTGDWIEQDRPALIARPEAKRGADWTVSGSHINHPPTEADREERPSHRRQERPNEGQSRRQGKHVAQQRFSALTGQREGREWRRGRMREQPHGRSEAQAVGKRAVRQDGSFQPPARSIPFRAPTTGRPQSP